MKISAPLAGVFVPGTRNVPCIGSGARKYGMGYPSPVSSWLLALIAKPLAAFILLGCILLPARFAIIKWFPEGSIKRLLLTHLWDDPRSD